MVDTTERKHITTPPPHNRLGAFSSLLGAVFLAFGVAVIAIVWFTAQAAPAGSPTRARAALPIAFGAFFVATGATFVGVGLSGIAGRRRRARQAAAYPEEPWRADYDWDPEGQRDRSRVDVVGRLVGIIFLCFLLALLDYWVFGIGAGPVATVLVVLANLLGAWAIGKIVIRGVQLERYGRIAIRYDRFPFFLGEPLEARVVTARPLPPRESLRAHLRFIEERMRLVGDSQQPDYFQLYEDETSLMTDGSAQLALRFDLPAGDRVSELSTPRRRFWELQLQGTLEGAAFDERFVLPVYRRPRAR